MARVYKRIDSDGHILEPVTLWNDYMDPNFRERAPKLIIDNDGRGGGARPVEALYVTHIHALSPQAGADCASRRVVASAAPQLGLSTEPRDRDGRVCGHPSADLDVLDRTHFRGLRRKRLNPINTVERGVSHTNDALRRWHSSVRACRS